MLAYQLSSLSKLSSSILELACYAKSKLYLNFGPLESEFCSIKKMQIIP